MRKLNSATALAALLGLLSCGGGQGTTGLGQSNSLTALPVILDLTQSGGKFVQGQPLPELTDTLAPEPLNLDGALAEAAGRQPNTVSKQSSAVVINLPVQTVSATSSPTGVPAHDYEPKLGQIWTDAQSTILDSEYHILGTVYSANLAADQFSYASLGLVNWFNYDYAVNQQAQPRYLFNQSLYIHIRRVGSDAPGTVRVRLNDSNGKWHAEFTNVPLPFNFDLRLVPTNPIQSTPAVAPFTSHRCGLAELSVNGFPLPGAMEYGNDNWGWRTAAGPERFDAGAGGVTLLGQAYASGASVTAGFNYDASFISGPLAVPEPANWYTRAGNRTRNGVASVNGPQAPGVRWVHAAPISSWLGGPALDATGNSYVSGTGSLVHGVDNLGAAIPNWPFAMAAGTWSGLVGTSVGIDGTIYAADATATDINLYAINPNGLSAKWAATLTVPAPFLATNLIEVGPYLYITYGSGGNSFVLVLTKDVPSVVANTPIGSLAGLASPAFRADAQRFYVNGENISCLAANGAPLWTFVYPGGTETFTSSQPVVAPDGNVFVGSNSGLLVAIRDNGASGSVDPTFGVSGIAGGILNGCSVAIGDDGGGMYTVYTPSSTGVRAYNQNASLQWLQPAVIAGNFSSPVLGADRKLYVGGSDGSVYCLDPTSGTILWSIPLSPGLPISATPAIGLDGDLYVHAGDGNLYAISDSVASAVTIDNRSLSGASFSLFDAGGVPLTGTLDTDVVYDATPLGLTATDQFYVSFAVDPAASPTDHVLYPPRPDNQAGGLVTVGANSLAIDPSLAPYFSNPPGTRTLVLNPSAFNRVTNDLSALPSAQFSLFDQAAGSTFAAPVPTNLSAGLNAVLAANLQYRIDVLPLGYPHAGGAPLFLGAAETVYPQGMAGRIAVGFGSLSESAAIAGPDNDLTDYYDQAAMVNTLQPDAYCRFEAVAGPGIVARYGLRDAILGSWIVVPSFPFGREPFARPFDVFLMTRGSRFEISDGLLFSSPVDVTPGRSLNGTAYPNTQTVAFPPSSFDLRSLPVRVWDDPAQPNPGQPGALVTGSGPWQLPVNFLVQYGSQPLTVELDADYGGSVADSGPGSPAAWNDGTPGKVYTLFSAASLSGDISQNLVIPVLHGAGTYTLAIRVTDNSGAQYTYVWTDPATFGAGPPLVTRGDWYMSGGNRKGNGQSSFEGPASISTGWTVTPGGALTEAGIVLNSLDEAFTSFGPINGAPAGPARYMGLDSLGNMLPGWAVENLLESTGESTAVVGTDGTVYFGAGSDDPAQLQGVIAINRDGSIRWTFDAPVGGARVMADLACESGRVYCVVSHDTADIHTLYTLNANTGAMENSLDVGPLTPGAGKRSRGGFAIGDTGVVYYSGFDRLWVLNPDGTLRYSSIYTEQPSGVHYGNPVIAPDGIIFVTDGGGVRSYLDIGAALLPHIPWGVGGYLSGAQFAGLTPVIRDLGPGQYDVYLNEASGPGMIVRRYDTTGVVQASSALLTGTPGQMLQDNSGDLYVAGNAGANSIYLLDQSTLAGLGVINAGGNVMGMALGAGQRIFYNRPGTILAEIP